MKKIWIPQKVAETGTDFLRERGYEIIEDNNLSKEAMKKHIKECDAILLRTAKITKELIEESENLKIIARHGVGYDNIDLATAKGKGIWVTNTPTALSDSVAEYTITGILMCCKNIWTCNNAMRKGDFFFKNDNKGIDLMGKTLSIIGLGRIGRAVAKKAHFGFGMNVIAYLHNSKQENVPDYITLVEWESAFKLADFVTLHIPYTKETSGIIGRKEFQWMKPTAYLINTARGEVVKEEELLEALLEKKIKGAFLDVLGEEPAKNNNPFWDRENVYLTPHMASNTKECMERMALYAAMEIDRVLSGQNPRWSVHPYK